MANNGWTPESNEGVGQCGNVAIAANEDGRLEIYTYSLLGLDNIYHKWQEWDAQQKDIVGFSNWESLPASKDDTYFDNALNGNLDILVGLTAIEDSCIQVVTQGAWGLAQKSKDGLWPDHISRLGGGPSRQTMMTAMARSSTGALYAFGVDQGSYDIHYAKQSNAGGNWAWHTIGHPPKVGGFAVRVDDWNFRSRVARGNSRTLGAGGDLDGRIELFYGSDWGIWSICQTAAGIDNWEQGALRQFPGYNNYADWTAIQNNPLSQDDLAGRLELFALAVNKDGTYALFHSWQFKSNGTTGWSEWEPIPGLSILQLPTQNLGHPFLKGPLRTARQKNGSIVIFATGVDPAKGNNSTSLFYVQQDGPGAPFRKNWVNLGGDNITAFDIGQNIDGTLFAVINSGQQIWHRQQINADSDNWTT